MSDPTLTQVAVTASGLPQQFGLLSYKQQVPIPTKAVDLSKFQNPAYGDQYVERYLALNQENGTGTGSATGILSLFGSNGAQPADLLGTLIPSDSTGSSSGGLIGALFSTTA